MSTTTPASPASLSGGGSPQSISNCRPPTNHSASWNRPPREPLPWTWTCHECHTSWPLATTQRCLQCDHKLCNSYQQAANSSTSSRKRKRGGSCKTSFDYMGWAARGAWRRTLLLNAKDGGECDSHLSLVTSSPSSHKMTLRSSKRQVGETAPTISSTTKSSSRPALEQHTVDQNNLQLDTPDENGILASNNLWLTPHSLSFAWGDEHSAMRRRNEAQLVDEFNPQREALFVRRLHNCWLHCDFPSECRTVAMQARAEGRPVGQEAKEVDECYLKEQRRKIRRLKEASHEGGGGETRTLLPSSRPKGRWGQPMGAQEWSGDDDEDEDEDEDDEAQFSSSSSSSSTDDEDFKNSPAGITLWQSYKSTGNKPQTIDDAKDRVVEQISTIVRAKEYDSDDERSPTSPSRPPLEYIGPKPSIFDETSISNSNSASLYQSFSIPPPSAPNAGPAVPMEAKLDLSSPRDVDAHSNSERSLPTISEEDEDGQSTHDESEDEVQIFLDSLLVDAQRNMRETRQVHRGVQLASSGEPQARCSSQQTSQTAFESFPSFEEHQQRNDKRDDQSKRGKNDKDDQDEVEDEAEFDRQLRQAYSEKSWYPETDKDINETSKSGSATNKKARQYRRTVFRRQRAKKMLMLLRRRIEGVAGSGAGPSTRSSSPSEGIDVDGAVESLTDDSDTLGSSRTPSPPIELDAAVVEGDGFRGLGEFEDEDWETLGYIQPSSVAGGRPWGSRVLDGALSTSAGLKSCEVAETTTMIVDHDF